MASGFFANLDDIAAIMDDVAVTAKLATKKTAPHIGASMPPSPVRWGACDIFLHTPTEHSRQADSRFIDHTDEEIIKVLT